MKTEIVSIESIKGFDKVADQLPLCQKKINRYAESIKISGLLVPIVLCRSLIIDGRHRYEAHKILGLKTITCRVLAYKTSPENKIKERDNMEFERRHQTPTQLACTSILLIEEQILMDKKMTAKEASKLTNASTANIGRAKFIRKNNPKYFDILYNDGAVDNGTKNGTKSLKTVQELIESQAKSAENFNDENDASDDHEACERQARIEILEVEVKAMCIKLGMTEKFSNKETLELLMSATRNALMNEDVEGKK